MKVRRDYCSVCKSKDNLADGYYSYTYSKGVRIEYSICLPCKRDLREKQRVSVLKAADKKQFGGNREKAIERDGGKCVGCGVTREQHKQKYKGRDITVDHIDGNGRNTPVALKNNHIDNLQTLCLRCHGKKDIKRRKNANGGRRKSTGVY